MNRNFHSRSAPLGGTSTGLSLRVAPGMREASGGESSAEEVPTVRKKKAFVCLVWLLLLLLLLQQGLWKRGTLDGGCRTRGDGSTRVGVDGRWSWCCFPLCCTCGSGLQAARGVASVAESETGECGDLGFKPFELLPPLLVHEQVGLRLVHEVNLARALRPPLPLLECRRHTLRYQAGGERKAAR